MRIELEINEIKELVYQQLLIKYNVQVLESNFTYDLVDFDESLFGLSLDVMDKNIYAQLKAEIEEEKRIKESA